MDYTVYILVCADGTLYTGIARDPQKRLREHNGDLGKGARYTSSRRPVQMVYAAVFGSRSEALREELRIKGLPRDKKQLLIAAYSETSIRCAHDTQNDPSPAPASGPGRESLNQADDSNVCNAQ